MGRGGANSSEKKKKKENEAFFSQWTKIVVPWNAVYLVLAALKAFLWQGFTFWKLVGSAGLIVGQALSFFLILHAREKLGNRAKYEYQMDVLLVCMGVQMLSLVTDYAWYLLLVIPAFVVFLGAKMGYELFFGGGVLGLLGLGGGGGGGGGKVPMPNLPSKKKREDMTKAELRKDDLRKKRRERKDRKQGIVRQPGY